MFTQSADHDNENLREEEEEEEGEGEGEEEEEEGEDDRHLSTQPQPPSQSSIFQKQHRQEQEQEQEYPSTNTEQLQPPPKESQITSAATSSCYGYGTLASSSNNYSNHFKTTTTTSSNISLPWPPPPPLVPSIEQQQQQPIPDALSSNSGHRKEAPILSRSSPNSIENTHYAQPNFLNTNITIPRRLDNKNNLSEECRSQQQQLAGSSGSRQINIEQIAQQRYQNHRQQQQQNYNQSQLLKWQGNSDVTTPINQSIINTNYTISGAGAGAIATPISASGTNITNVNYHLPHSQQGPLFSNQDNNNSNCTLAGAATKPFQEELTTLHSAIRAMSWNHSLRHDQLYRARHNNSSPYASGNGGQDYYRQLYQQRRFHHHHQQQQQQQQQQQGGFEAGFMQQDNHATKMMKLDSSSVGIARQHHQYPYYGSTFGAGGHQSSGPRDIQQIRYQLQPIRSNTSSFCATNNSSGSNSSSSGKELKENHTDLESSNYHDGKSKDIKDNQQQQQQQQHLVKTISDLPVFVTIEDFRVASYTIAGEPHLCLPQLLQFLRQHFDTKTMVEKFEESLIHFPSANPKQVEGFIKSSCLPPSAKSCPLIKRSDADKICLSLFEELSKTNVIKHPSDIVGLCTKQQPQQQNQEKYSEEIRDKTNDTSSIDEKRSNYSPTRNTESSEKPFVKEPTDSIISIDNIYVDKVTMDNSTNPLQSQSPRDVSQQEKNVIVASYSDDKYATVTKKLKCNNDESDSTRSDSSSTQDASEHSPSDGDRNEQIELSHDKISPTTSLSSSSSSGGGDDDVKVKKKEQAQSIEPSSGTTSGNVTHDTLFESEAQSSILNFARAITSTLMIRVYHKCFGKCIGLFYPSLLKSKRFECIQCTTCKIMLTPRRFVGHTHGSKENDVCHWGFNSYNWRSYIRLSKKQPMNSLDEDELLRQFSALSSTSYDRNIDRQPSTSASTLTVSVSAERKDNLQQPCCASTSTARVDSNYQQNSEQPKYLDSSVRLARTDRQNVSSGQATTSSEGSTPQPSTSNLPSMGQNISISTLRGYNNLDESSSSHLLTPSTSSSSQSGGPKQLVSNSQYLNQPTSNLDDRGFTRLARSASLSGRIPYSACCSGSLAIPTPTVLTPQQSTEQYGLANTMNPYPVIPTTNTVTPNLFSSQSDQLTGDLRNFLLQNWSTPSTVPHPHLQPPPPSRTSATTTQLPMLPLGPLGIPITAGQTCNSLPPTEVPRPSRSSNNLDFTKHLSLSAESKRELHVCTNLSTYLSRRGLSAGMTGDIVEKVLNLMRESRSTL